MKAAYPIIALVAIGGGIFAYKAYQTKNVGDALQTSIKPNFEKFGLKGGKLDLKITTDLIIKNPKSTSIELTHPNCILFLNNTQVASAPIINKKYYINKLSTQTIRMNLLLDGVGAVSLAVSLGLKLAQGMTLKDAFNSMQPRIDYSLYANNFEVKESQPLTA